MRTSCVARIGAVAPARLPRTQTGPSPMLSVAEAKPSFVPAIVSRNGARWSRSGSSSRGPTWGVPESLVLTGNGSPGCERLRRDPARPREGGRDLLGRALEDPAWRAGVRRDRPDVEAAARERACGVREHAAVAAPGRQSRRPARRGSAAAAHRRRAGSRTGSTSACRVLADEGDPAPVRRPVGIAVAAAARHLPVADVEIAVADETTAAARPREASAEVFQATAASRGSGASATAVRRSRARPAMPPYAARRGRTASRFRRRTSAAASASVATGPTHTSSPSKSSQPRRERPLHENGSELGCELVLGIGEQLALGELRPPDQLAEPDEELRLERADGELPPVGRRVDPVAGEPTREEARQRVAAEPVRDEPVRAVRHRDRRAGRRARCAPARAALPGSPRRRRVRRRRGRRAAAAAGRARCPRARPPSRGS